MKLYIDDIRNPKSNDWKIVRSSDDAIKFIENNGMVDYISFDHDLGGDDTSMIFIKWLINKDIDEDIIKENFDWFIHSDNIPGSENIDSILNCYMNFKFNKN